MTPVFARVVLPIPLDRAFDYAVPEAIASDVAPGKRLLVPFRNAEKTAYCVDLPEKPEVENPKSVLAVLDDEPLLDAHMLELTRWMARYYAAGHGEVLDAVLPAAVKKPRAARKMTFISLTATGEFLEKKLDSLKRKPNKQQKKIVAVLSEKAAAGISEVYAPLLRELAGVGSGPVGTLARAGIIKLETRVLPADTLRFYASPGPPEDSITLSSEQENALDEINDAVSSGEFRTLLLHGVTGSGKTEVYLRALSRVVEAGAQGIVLVPEIALTPQTVSWFASRFENVVILHSALSDRERREAWKKAASGEADIIVGPRSAVFAPARNLGLIVVDEEHEGSFKQENTPRYHGRDVAVMRAKLLGIPVILGSATPDLVTLANARTGKYTYLPIKHRVTACQLPPVKILDMARECREQRKKALFAREFVNALAETFDRKEQAILLMNRRGFHTQAACPTCGYVMKCRWCDVPMTFHRGRNRVVCHYCGHEEPAPRLCPDCGLSDLKYTGKGTERVMAELSELFPDARIARMDSDTMSTRSDYEKTLLAFARGDVNVLVGTQMIAKGLDFPNVTLVCAVQADGGLMLPDFRASERTFQLLVQVAGRAGRGEAPGRVFFQAFQCEHYAISAAARHDYDRFAKEELEYRRKWKYPPFVRLARIVVEGPDAAKVKTEAAAIREKLGQAAEKTPGSSVLGPAACPIGQVKGSTRMHVLIKAKSSGDVQALLVHIGRPHRPRGVQKVIVDVDPLTIL